MDKKEQTIVEHLSEFRNRLIQVLIYFLLTFIVAFLFAGDVYGWLTMAFNEKLIVLGPNDILWIYVQLASLASFTFTLPFMTYQIWKFLRPALQVGEARAVLAYVPATFVCFFLGLLFGFYFVSPAILSVLLSLGNHLFETKLTAQNYLTFLLHTTVPIAVLFELPVFVAFLTSIGLLNPSFLVQYRRYAYFTLLVIAVIITPADFISDLVMTAPLILIFEISVSLSKMIYNRKMKRSS